VKHISEKPLLLISFVPYCPIVQQAWHHAGTGTVYVSQEHDAKLAVPLYSKLGIMRVQKLFTIRKNMNFLYHLYHGVM
jgi:hypothetical protein